METKEITTPQPTAPAESTPFSLIAHAVQSGQMDVETVKELVALQREMKADAAREAYVKAMAAFQSECPVIEKTKPVKNKHGEIVYYYAPLESIVKQAGPFIAKNGLSYSFDTTSDEKELTAICKVTHAQGHVETTTFKVPIGSEAYMTDVQKFGARSTFAKRNAFCNAFGILTGEEDTDGTQTGKDKTPKDPKSKIVMLLKSLGKDTSNRERTPAIVMELTGLESKESNLDDIIDRLSALVEARNADNSKE
jgi:hypothetical protein